MKPPVQLLVPRNFSTTAGPRNRPSPVSKSRRVVGVRAKVLVSWEMPPVAMRMRGSLSGAPHALPEQFGKPRTAAYLPR